MERGIDGYTRYGYSIIYGDILYCCSFFNKYRNKFGMTVILNLFQDLIRETEGEGLYGAAMVGYGKITLLGLSVCLVMIIFPDYSAAEPGRWEQELSGTGWRLWLDRKADWTDDTLYLPPVDVHTLPVNPPTCGWDNLERVCMMRVNVPGTVEEYFWSKNGNLNGVAGDYRGVSWWSRTFRVDSSLRGKRIILSFESVNLCAEVYVNHTLVG